MIRSLGGLLVGQLDDVHGGGAGRNHRIAVLVRIDAGVDDGRAAAVERGLERRVEVVLVVDHEAGAAESLGELCVVGHLLRQMRLGVALGVEELLPLAHHPEPAVVDDHDHDRQPFERRGRELLAGHLEAAVAVDADDRGIGPRGLRPDCGRNAVAHRPEAAGGDEGARLLALDVLHRPHLVLADTGRPDVVALALRGQVAEPLDHRLRLEDAVGLAVLVRVERSPFLDLRVPGGAVGALLGLERLHVAGELRQRELERADDRDVGRADLPHLGGVDVEVDHLRAGCERRDLAGDAVVEARADRDDQVGLVERPVRVLRAVHSGRAVVQRVRVG